MPRLDFLYIWIRRVQFPFCLALFRLDILCIRILYFCSTSNVSRTPKSNATKCQYVTCVRRRVCLISKVEQNGSRTRSKSIGYKAIRTQKRRLRTQGNSSTIKKSLARRKLNTRKRKSNTLHQLLLCSTSLILGSTCFSRNSFAVELFHVRC